MQSLASDHFRLLGARGVSDPPLVSTNKITDWDTRLEVLGWIIDTEALTVTLPSRKRLKLSSLLADCLLYTSPSPRDGLLSRMPSSA